MPIDVELKVQTLKELQGRPEARVPTDALRDFFSAFDIRLTFTEGEALSPDPTDFEDTIDDFLDAHAPAVGSTGAASLLVSDLGFRGLAANGMLLDVRRRGACAVFTQAAGFDLGDVDGRFEIYAHEIGHLLNLTHDDAGVPNPWAMNSWDQRSDVADLAGRWRKAISDGPSDYANRTSTFFGSGTRHPIGLPMSPRCCTSLLTSPSADIEPWMSAFVGDDPLDLADTKSERFELGLEVHGEKWGVGYPLDASITLRLKSGVAGCEVPHLVDRASGELELELEEPGERRRRLQSRRQVCTSLKRWLRPRQSLRRDESLIVDRDGLVFPKSGRYRVRACVPQLQVRSDWVTIDVADEAFAPAALQEFLRRGLPDGSEAGWRGVNELLNSCQLAPQLAADLVSRASAKGMRKFEALRTFRKMATPAVAQRDVLRRIARVRRTAPGDSRPLHILIDDAERLFSASDAQHPTLEYLAHLRRRTFVQKNGGKP